MYLASATQMYNTHQQTMLSDVEKMKNTRRCKKKRRGQFSQEKALKKLAKVSNCVKIKVLRLGFRKTEAQTSQIEPKKHERHEKYGHGFGYQYSYPEIPSEGAQIEEFCLKV